MLFLLRWFIYLLLLISGYRKKVIRQNIEIIAHYDPRIDKEKTYRLFVKYFARLFSEILYSFNISQNGILKRVSFNNPQLVSETIKEKGGAFLLTAHYGNWEISSLAMPSVFGEKLGAIYLTHRSKRLFDKGRNGICFIADQAPANPSTAHWTTFMGRLTAFSPGIERMSKLLKWPVIYGHIQPDGKGNYELFFEKICDDPNTLPSGEITRQFASKLQSEILKNPHYWLLSHRRWKHNPDEFSDKIIV